MSLNLFQMSDDQLGRMVDRYNDRLLDDHLNRPEPKCKDCFHYCKRTKQCDAVDCDDYNYVDPNDDACDNFVADDHEPEEEY